MESEGLEYLIITSLPNIKYLSGFTGSSACALVGRRCRLIFTDSRYELQARREAPGYRIIIVSGNEMQSRITECARALRIRRMGFEPDSITYGAYRRLRRACGKSIELVAAPSLVERLRMVKGGEELLAIAKAARMADGVLFECRRRLIVGMTEREVAHLIERLVLEAGSDEAAFRPIVASGSHAAMPHCRPGESRIGAGKPLLIDLGVSVSGYNSDLTRTYLLGRLAAQYRAVYTAVLEAQQAALQVIKPGVAASLVDAAARECIASHGFAGRFRHSLGHGIGIEVHEAPRLSRESNVILEEGMIFTVEPGIYIQGWGGVRIEDMVRVERGGCRLLTSSARDLEGSLL